MLRFKSISARLMVVVSIIIAAACAVLGTSSVFRQGLLTQLALDQQLALQYDSVIAALDYKGRAALAVSGTIAALPPQGE